MKLSSRELTLGSLTVGTLLIGASYLIIAAKVQDWKATNRAVAELGSRMRRAERTRNQGPEWYERLDGIRGQLPHHPLDKDVTAELLRTLERTAQDHSLTLLRREPQKERSLGDLYEVSINCTWEGTLDHLVHFLYAIHTKGVILDVQQLGVTPVPRQQGRLKGSFTVDCAYIRESGESGEGGLSVVPTP